MLHLLADLHEDGISIVLTTHDLNGMAAHLPHLVCVNRRIVAEGTPDEVITAPVLEQTFGARLEVLEHLGMPVVVDDGACRHGPAREPAVRERTPMTDLSPPPRPVQYAFFQKGIVVATISGALLGLDRRLHRPARDELHRPRPLARDLRRIRGQLADRAPAVHARGRHLGRGVGARPSTAWRASTGSAPTPRSA